MKPFDRRKSRYEKRQNRHKFSQLQRYLLARMLVVELERSREQLRDQIWRR